MAILEVTGLSKHFGDLEVIRRHQLFPGKGRVAGHHRLLRQRQDHASALPDGAGNADTGVIRVSGDTVFDASSRGPRARRRA